MLQHQEISGMHLWSIRRTKLMMPNVSLIGFKLEVTMWLLFNMKIRINLRWTLQDQVICGMHLWSIRRTRLIKPNASLIGFKLKATMWPLFSMKIRINLRWTLLDQVISGMHQWTIKRTRLIRPNTSFIGSSLISISRMQWIPQAWKLAPRPNNAKIQKTAVVIIWRCAVSMLLWLIRRVASKTLCSDAWTTRSLQPTLNSQWMVCLLQWNA